MKLQLWTTDVTGQPDDLLGEVEIGDDEWADAQTDSGSALGLIQDLADEVDGGVS